jgi:hypothetical protein
MNTDAPEPLPLAETSETEPDVAMTESSSREGQHASGWFEVFAVVAAVAIAVALGLRPSVAESTSMWLFLVVPYALLCAWIARKEARRGRLRDRLRFKSGDVTLGILLGLFMAAAGMLAVKMLLPSSSLSQVWLFQIYAQVGDVQNTTSSIGVLVLLAVMEEFVWRGFVLSELTLRVGPRLALPLSALLYGAAHSPTLFTFYDSTSGHNPVLVLAAMGAGLVWGFAMRAFGRLWPVALSHAVFTYFMAAPLPAFLSR